MSYSIREAAKELGVEAYVLRYWEDELGIEIPRNDMGHRCYSDRDLRMFREIQKLKEKGLALKTIRDAISKSRLTVTEINDCGADEQDCKAKEQEYEPDSDLKVVDFKLAQLQKLMNKVVANAMIENKSIITSSLKGEITEDVMKQMDVIIREQEEREEERFRKLDEVLRKMQRVNEEVAASKHKKRLFGKSRK